MNESARLFDMFLERELRQMLDPVVEAAPPTRGERVTRSPEPILVPEPVVEPVPLTVTAASVPQL